MKNSSHWTKEKMLNKERKKKLYSDNSLNRLQSEKLAITQKLIYKLYFPYIFFLSEYHLKALK